MAEHHVDNVSSMGHSMPFFQTFADETPQEPSDDELMHEVLAMNTLAMQRCNEAMLDEANTILGEAYMKLHNHVSSSDTRMIDTLRSITLNNLGVVECHRGQHRQALSHFETARQLEEAWNSASPSVALNSCAAYNALGMYDKATAAATETIGMLRSLAIQEKNGTGTLGGSATDNKTATNGTLSLHEDGIVISNSDSKVLWGAAWHNMAVAQINTAKLSKDPSEHSNVVILFHNAMRSTQELLGKHHPMTKSVTATYRAVRDALRSHGVYKQHHTLLTVPSRPVDPRDEDDMMERYYQQSGGLSRRRAKDKYHHDLTITFYGEVTNGVRLKERLDPTPYPGAKDVPFRITKRKKMPHVLRGMPLSETLMRAGQLYGNPHPLLCSTAPDCHGATTPTARHGYTQGKNNSHACSTSNRQMAGTANTSSVKHQPKQPIQKPMPSSYQYVSLSDQQTYWHTDTMETSNDQPEKLSQHHRSSIRQESHYHHAAANSPVAPERAWNTRNEPRESMKGISPRNRADLSSSERMPRPPSPQRVLPPLNRASRDMSSRRNPAVESTVAAAKSGTARGNSSLRKESVPVTNAAMSSMRPAYEQIKYILLADPQKGKAKQHEKVGNASVSKSLQMVSAQVNAGVQSPGSEWLVKKDDGTKSHRLFDAMWVTANASLDGSATRTVGRPSYFVSSSVDLSKEPLLLPEEVMQMIVESSSSSLGDDPS